MAGVVPQLRRDRPQIPVVVFRSWVGGDFQAALTSACIEEVWRTATCGQPKPAETLPFDEILRACSEAAHETILVLFDQFEEYFLYHAKSADPESFEAQFARAVNREDVDIGFLVALREDGLSKLDRFQERIPELLSNRLRLKHLDKTGAERDPLAARCLEQRVTRPAPVTIENELVAELIEQVKIGRVAVGRQGGSGARRRGRDVDRGALPPVGDDPPVERGNGRRVAAAPPRHARQTSRAPGRSCGLTSTTSCRTWTPPARPCAPASSTVLSPLPAARWRARG